MADINEHEPLNSRVFINRKQYFGKLENEVLSWCRCRTHGINSEQSHSLNIKRVITIKPCESMYESQQKDIEMNILNEENKITSFCLHVVAKKDNLKWHHRKAVFTFPSAVEGTKWFKRIEDLLKGYNRPKKLLVFVNPYGGRRQAPRIFQNKVRPLFNLAEIEFDFIETERANHAKDHIMNEDTDLNQYDGIISIGGDGMFSEILNGILMRHNPAVFPSSHFMPKKGPIKLGIIPAGSTDCVCFCTTGTIDVITSTLQIITNESQPLDISSLHNTKGELLRYSMSFAGYGFFGDVVKDSESLRWVGVKRYDISGAKMFMRNRSYEGELCYLTSSDTVGNPRDNMKCRKGCTVCSPSSSTTHGDILTAQSNGWHSITGRFISIMGATNCCANKKSPEGISPSAHLADGCIDLIIVRRTSRARYLQHMMRLAGKADHMDFDFVEVHRVKEFSFRPLPVMTGDKAIESDIAQSNSIQHSVWNVDGEIIDEPAIHIRVHRKLVNLFASGIEYRDTKCKWFGCK